MTLTLQALAQLCDAQIQDNAETPVIDGTLEISSAADIMTASVNQLTVLSNNSYAHYLKDTRASACLISPGQARKNAPDTLIFLVCDDPEISFLKAVNALHPPVRYAHSISKQAAIADHVTLGTNINIGAFASIGEETYIGDDTEIFANVTIGRQVTIGKNCRIHPAVVLYDHTQLGDNVILHSGVILGADGFGYKFRNNEHVKVPHVGNVVIEDNVEIGANTCIDKGTLGSTTIGAGSKIDNLVQLAHNNQVGKNVIICGQAGISGSCTIEEGVILAGGVALADHVTIGQQAVVLARSGVAGDIEPRAQVFGSPAKDRKIVWREFAAVVKLPELLKKFKKLEKRVGDLEE